MVFLVLKFHLPAHIEACQNFLQSHARRRPDGRRGAGTGMVEPKSAGAKYKGDGAWVEA